MDLDLTADQKLFRTTTRKFLDNETPLTKVRELSEGADGFERDWWNRGAELGWAAMLVPEELGGGSVSGNGLLDLAIVAEEMGQLVSPGPLLPTNAVIAGLVQAQQDGPDHTEEIERLAAGDAVASWAVYEPGAGWQPGSPGVTARAKGDGYVLEGVKDRVEAAGQADLFLVTAQAEAGPMQFVVDATASGVTVLPSTSLDIARRFGEVHLNGVEVPPDAVVGTAAGTPATMERQLQVALVLQCAETAGAIDRVFEFTLRWAFDRYSFGRPLASYQALKHRFADMRVWLEACHATSEAAAHAVQHEAPDAAELVSVAKSYIGGRAPEIVQDCVQLHGGIGVTWEHDLHLYLRRVTVNTALYGTPEEHRRRIADLLDV
ncbi:acyl-CoA dehydrogenase family protein [Acrocarpospora sp. B8E8]|uniref:acyl-CoA dehydrogenase family protein n=1 Tax=Acrocarpospora sp. B8E8 TaxID=3153572 RepID=UPI00325D7764